MIEREASSPPDVSAASTPGPNPVVIHSGTPPPARKRKYASIVNTPAASSPAPSESGFPNDLANTGVTAANVHASASRPRLTISRGPVFVLVGDGEYYTTEQTAVNRLGFRYVPAGLAEPGSKIPYRTIESRPQSVRVSWEDRSPFLRVTQDGLGLCGEKGFRSARLNVPVREGNWYLEVKIDLGGGETQPDGLARRGAHVRLGWGRREAPLNGPVGLDGYSYGCRDLTGDKVTLSRPRPYGSPFKSGDVVGMYISLPPKRKAKANDLHDPAHIRRERIAIDFKGQEYFESVEYPQSKEMVALMDSNLNKSKATASVPSSSKKSATVKNVPDRGRGNRPADEPSLHRPLPTLTGSHIAFFVNGKYQGVAFQDIYDYLQLRTVPASRKTPKRKHREGIREHTENPFDDGWLGYYPLISLFNGAQVRLNPGPDFTFPPPADIEGVLAGDADTVDTKTRTWRPLCERYAEFMAEQWALDEKEEAEAQAALPTQEAIDEAEAKAAVRREKKRQSEQKRRARKAEEGRVAKLKEKDASRERSLSAFSAGERFGPLAAPSCAASLYSQPYSPTPMTPTPDPSFNVPHVVSLPSEGHLLDLNLAQRPEEVEHKTGP